MTLVQDSTSNWFRLLLAMGCTRLITNVYKMSHRNIDTLCTSGSLDTTTGMTTGMNPARATVAPAGDRVRFAARSLSKVDRSQTLDR